MICVSIRPAVICNGTRECYEPIQRLCDERYGEGYLTRADFNRWLRNPPLFQQARVDGVFAGFAVMIPASEEEVMDQMDMPREDVREATGGRPALIYKTAAVLPQYEKRGIMSAMAETGIEKARALGYGALFASAWVHSGRIPMEHIFQSFGFEQMYPRKMLWYRYENYRCVVCGGRCVCDAMIYRKKL